jgi:hypothetical protein
VTVGRWVHTLAAFFIRISLQIKSPLQTIKTVRHDRQQSAKVDTI